MTGQRQVHLVSATPLSVKLFSGPAETALPEVLECVNLALGA